VKKLHAIAGLPRSGSTLLCNILAQNPKFHVTSTSPLPAALVAMSGTWSQNPDIKGLLQCDQQGTQTRMAEAARGFVRAWYQDTPDVVFDKSRAWSVQESLLRQLFPEAVLIVTVRDLRNVIASIEKQHLKCPMLQPPGLPPNLLGRIDAMMGPEGLVGGAMVGIEGLVHRQAPYVLVPYEKFTADPQWAIDRVYEATGEKAFKHDFNNVENRATDPDELYLYKYPHEGSGKVTPGDPQEWQKFMTPDIAQQIMQRFAFFNRTFGYI
jgi:sulfotransferase